MSNSNSNNYTLCNALEQNVTLVRNCNELVTHLVNAYPDRVQQFAKKAFRINVKEKRPFSLHDYPYLTKGNFRQIMHKLKGQTIKVTQTHPARYVLNGVSLPESTHKVTHDHMWVGKNYYDLLTELQVQDPEIHDVKLKITNVTLHEHLVRKGSNVHPKNKGIKVDFPNIDNNKKTTVMVYPNMIQIHIACTYTPFIQNSTTVWLFHEYLSKLSYHLEALAGNAVDLPPTDSWIITHQHLNKDGSISLCGQSFEFKVKDFNTGLLRFYSKRFEDGTVKPRLEQIQTPDISIRDAMKQAMFGELK